MAIKTRLDLINVQKTIQDFGLGLSAEDVAAFARKEISEADAHNTSVVGRRLEKETFVNGVSSNDFSRIRPGGSIVAVWEFGQEIIAWCYERLREESPVLTGEYRESISIFADGVMVRSPADAANASEVVMMATVPYARKIEGVSGKDPKKHMSSQAPDGVFSVVASAARKRFGNQAKIDFTFRGLSGGATGVERWAAGKARRNTGRKNPKRDYQKNVRNPAILIRFR